MAPRKYDPTDPEPTNDSQTTASESSTADTDRRVTEKLTDRRDRDEATTGRTTREETPLEGTRSDADRPVRDQSAADAVTEQEDDRGATGCLGRDRTERAADKSTVGEDRPVGRDRTGRTGTASRATDRTAAAGSATDRTAPDRTATERTTTDRTTASEKRADRSTTEAGKHSDDRLRDRLALELQRGKNRRLTDLGLLILRLSMALLALHGLYKIQHFDGVRQMMGNVPIGSAAPDVFAVLQTLAEFALPLLLILGLFTRLAALALAADMGLLWVLMHFSKPPLIVEQGALNGENAMMFALVALTLLCTGAGRYALDHAFGHKRAHRRAKRRAQKLA